MRRTKRRLTRDKNGEVTGWSTTRIKAAGSDVYFDDDLIFKELLVEFEARLEAEREPVESDEDMMHRIAKEEIANDKITPKP